MMSMGGLLTCRLRDQQYMLQANEIGERGNIEEEIIGGE